MSEWKEWRRRYGPDEIRRMAEESEIETHWLARQEAAERASRAFARLREGMDDHEPRIASEHEAQEHQY